MGAAFLCLDETGCAWQLLCKVQCAKREQQSKLVLKMCMHESVFSWREDGKWNYWLMPDHFLSFSNSGLGRGSIFPSSAILGVLVMKPHYSCISTFSHSQFGRAHTSFWDWKEKLSLSLKRQHRWTVNHVFCNSWSVTPGWMMLILGGRHSWYFGSPPGGQEHHWDAGYHCPGTSACCRALCHGCVWAVWAQPGGAGGALQKY